MQHAGREWELLVDGLGKLEAPCPDGRGRLLFADMADPGAILRLERDGTVATVVADRAHVGGIVPLAGGGFVVSGHTVAAFADDGTPLGVLMDAGDGFGFNDLTTDASGNVYVGLHPDRPTGARPERPASLWRIAPGGAVDRCYGDVLLSNGLRISPDGTRLYHNDSVAKVVWVSDLEPGELPSNRRVFHESDGFPDGMAIDEDGGVWIALVTSGRVERLAPDGGVDVVVETPRQYPTAVCFGGDDGRDLYVTSFGAPYDKVHGGSVMRTRVDHAGLPLTPTRT